MSTTWDVNLRTMRHKRVLSPDESTVELTWRVRATIDGVEGKWDPFTYALTVVEDAGMPRPGDKLTGFIDDTTSEDWSNFFRCRDITWQHLDDSFSVWEAKATFTSKDAFCPAPYIYRTDSTRLRSVDLWHYNGPTTAMIESAVLRHPVDAADYFPCSEMGKPIKTQVPQQEITISYVWNTAVASDSGNGYPNLQAVIDGQQAYLESRNTTEFLGFPKGTVRLMGITVDPDRDEYVRVSYLFVYDYWGHMIQEPKLLPNGKPEPEQDADGFTFPKAINFLHTNPNGFAEFNDLLTQNEVDWLVKGWVNYEQVTCATSAAGQTALLESDAGKAQMDAPALVRVTPTVGGAP